MSELSIAVSCICILAHNSLCQWLLTSQRCLFDISKQLLGPGSQQLLFPRTFWLAYPTPYPKLSIPVTGLGCFPSFSSLYNPAMFMLAFWAPSSLLTSCLLVPLSPLTPPPTPMAWFSLDPSGRLWLFSPSYLQ